MNELEVNEYINEATEALMGTSEYERWWDALCNERKKLMDEHGANPGTIEGILFELWNLKIGYILNKYGCPEKKNREPD